jgi:exodeoxyribonuclease VII large subunit
MPKDDKRHFTVSELNALVRTLVEENFPEVSVLGEVSNLKRHTSGHVYFTLKDADAQVRAVLFRSAAERVGFELEDGAQVVATGRLTIYEAYGTYQVVVQTLEKAGVGALELAFRRLMERLEKEGLFDAARKKQLPFYPFRIAVVTSPTGAAVRDIISTLRRRWPPVEILLCPVAVQGSQAAPDIVRALSLLPSVPNLDLIILGRGGGSLEDLWAFNEETVARAIYACPVPIVSAVGHETDFTIADFVADVRAATPTMAAEIAVPRLDDLVRRMDELEKRLIQSARMGFELRKTRLGELVRSYALGRVRGRVETAIQAADYAAERLRRTVETMLAGYSNRLNESLARLEGYDAKRILSRGFVVCSDPRTGGVIRTTAAAIAAGDVRLAFADGRVSAEVKERVDGD